VCDHGSVANHYEILYLPLNGLDDAFDCRFGLHWRQDVICGLECDGHGFQAVIALSSTLLPHGMEKKVLSVCLLLVELCKQCHSLVAEESRRVKCRQATLIWPPQSRSQVSSSVWFPPRVMASTRSKSRFSKINFRVLIIGRANAGKTSILQRVCDTTESPTIYRSVGGLREQVSDSA